LDVGVVGEGPAVLAQAAPHQIVYLGANAPSPRGEAIIVHGESDITSMQELVGRSVAVHKGSNAHYLLLRALEEAGLSCSQLELSFLTPERARLEFESRRIDAWAIWDPLLASAEFTCAARVLRDASGLTENATYYIARRAFADEHPDLIEQLLEQVSRVSEWSRGNPAGVAEMLETTLGLPKEGLAVALGRGTSPGPVTHALIQSQQRIADTFHRLQLLPDAVSVAEAQWQRA
jgi:sulfonate transport system substrate-binding protein